jgi:hypothetical protein
LVRQKTKGCASIENKGDVKPTLNHRYTFARDELFKHPPLAGLVGACKRTAQGQPAQELNLLDLHKRPSSDRKLGIDSALSSDREFISGKASGFAMTV